MDHYVNLYYLAKTTLLKFNISNNIHDIAGLARLKEKVGLKRRRKRLRNYVLHILGMLPRGAAYKRVHTGRPHRIGRRVNA